MKDRVVEQMLTTVGRSQMNEFCEKLTLWSDNNTSYDNSETMWLKECLSEAVLKEIGGVQRNDFVRMSSVLVQNDVNFAVEAQQKLILWSEDSTSRDIYETDDVLSNVLRVETLVCVKDGFSLKPVSDKVWI